MLDEAGQYIASLTTPEGCTITDTILITTFYESIIDTIKLCPGDKIDYQGVTYSIGETILDTITSPSSCDTLLELFVGNAGLETI